MICLDASVVGMLISPDEKSDKILFFERLNIKCIEMPEMMERCLALCDIFVTSEFQKRNSDSPLLSDESKRGGQDRHKNSDVTPVSSFALQSYGARREDSARAQASAYLGERLTVYDASYLAIAEKYKAVLWTADKILFETASLSFSNLELIQ